MNCITCNNDAVIVLTSYGDIKITVESGRIIITPLPNCSATLYLKKGGK